MRNVYTLGLLFVCKFSIAQNEVSIPGEYYLRGVMETASGFKLNSDSSFEFFYSYGALDRYGAGTWKLHNDTIILNSRRRPAKDFALIKSERLPGASTILRMVDKNETMVRYVDVIFMNKKVEIEKTTNDKGLIQIPGQMLDSVALMFRLCPDRYSTFPVPREHNYFEFRFEPWIAEVFFDNFNLLWEKEQLTGKHPLLRGENYNYEK